MRTSESHPIRVDFAPAPAPERAVGMTFAPGKRQSDAMSGEWRRDLRADLRRLRSEYRVDVIVSLVEDAELTELGIADLVVAARDVGIEVVRYPIPDVSVPTSLSDTQAVVRLVLERLRAGKIVVTHCKGGLGRTGLITACVLVALGADPKTAIRDVRLARNGAIETAEQERFVTRFGSVR